ncbi:MAG: hypothetical protein KDN20_23935 [Verrucomicrobiae bacterium]|nr:hypothetical protein [Verrucomicrobiae bacterium]
MAETICAALEVDPDSSRFSSHLPYKTLNAAFPRDVVESEVRKIVQSEKNRLPGLTSQLVDWILGPQDSESTVEPLPAIPALQRIPKRFKGSLLFGQMHPRFHNRIISRCPFTFARVYYAELEDNGDDKTAYRIAHRDSKVPTKDCREFLDYRWAMLLANIRVDGLPLAAEHRVILHNTVLESGRFTPKQLIDQVEALTGSKNHNLKATFQIHPDSKDALIHDPCLAYYHGADRTSAAIHPFWSCLPLPVRKRALGRWRKGRPVTPGWMKEQLIVEAGDLEGFEKAVDQAFEKGKRAKKRPLRSRAEVLRQNFAPEALAGRAPYTREIMREAFAEVLAGRDPRSEGGVLYRSDEVLAAERLRPLDQLTNNHLVRHRLKILDRLMCDILAEYAGGDSGSVGRVIVEVARDLKEFSGMTAKEMAGELNGRLRDFKTAVAKLEADAPNLTMSGGLIRKCRLAMDLGWRCPFTGMEYDARDLSKMEREHIVPYADSPTNALYALVLTFPEVNRMKGRRTARAFIAAHEGQVVDGKPNLSLFTLAQYDEFVERLDIRTGHDDDKKRKRRRKDLMKLDSFEPREAGFTEGALTQSSHLMRLAARRIETLIPDLAPHQIIHLPGQVTAEVRKSWRLMDCLAAVVPEVRGQTENKQAIREITHLHHAVDAVTIGLAAHFLPKDGKVWDILLKRAGKRKAEEEMLLMRLGVFARTSGQRAELREPPEEILKQLESSLGECRVVQHLPADMNGLPAELNTWGVVSVDHAGPSPVAHLKQNRSDVVNGKRKREIKYASEGLSKLIGIDPGKGNGKLAAISGALVIGANFGIALDPNPTILPYFRVWHRLQALQEANGRKKIRIIRPGSLIRIKTNSKLAKQDYTGVWKVVSVKDNKSGLALDILRPEYVKAQNKVQWSGMNMRLATLISGGLEPVEYSLTGVKNVQRV